MVFDCQSFIIRMFRGRFVVILVLACAFEVVLAEEAENVKLKGDAADLELYTSNFTEDGDEQDVEVFDADGNLVTTTVVLYGQDFEIEKPEDRDVCLLKEIIDNSTCFEEAPMLDEVPDIVRDQCIGREILLLKEIECNTDTEEISEGETEEVAGRRKRSIYGRCCIWHRTVTTRCVSTKCCSYSFSWGRYKCRRRCCILYLPYITWSQRCISGYFKRF